MSRINEKSVKVYQEATASLVNGTSLDSGWINMREYDKYRISVFADSTGLDLIIDSSEVSGGGGVNDFQTTDTLQSSVVKSLVPREEFMRFRISNTTGADIDNVKFYISGSYGSSPGSFTSPLYIQPDEFSPAQLVRSVATGSQPDGDYINSKQDGSVDSTSSTLSADGVYTSDWFDTDGWNTIELFVSSDVESANQGIEIQFTDDAQAATPTNRGAQKFEFNAVDVKRGYKSIRIPTTLDGFRVVYTNGSTAQGDFYLDATLRVRPENAMFNKAGALITGKFEREVALQNVSNYGSDARSGRNGDVDTGTVPEDIWNGGGFYTGHDPTGNENLETFSSSANDAGTLLSSGTATGGSGTTLVDSTATFITDGVATGDIVINDSQGIHGIITSVDSETQVTVFNMVDGAVGEYANKSGDSYRIATPASTGAAVVRWTGILNEDYEKEADVYVIMNGTTGVTTTGNFYRFSRGRVVLAGSNDASVGDITARQATTTANVFSVMPAGGNSTSIAADTVPSNQEYLIESIETAITLASGISGSGNVVLNVRQFGEVFDAKRSYELQTGGPRTETLVGGIPVPPGSDIKLTVEDVSDNNTVATGSFEYLTIDL